MGGGGFEPPTIGFSVEVSAIYTARNRDKRLLHGRTFDSSHIQRSGLAELSSQLTIPLCISSAVISYVPRIAPKNDYLLILLVSIYILEGRTFDRSSYINTGLVLYLQICSLRSICNLHSPSYIYLF